ncbi:laccase-12-like [Cryptomeria japonica]|uniref:laccase-12-like n=1 Tax=Cryptomeria japonica TaxID=3369 RepID=UPI0027DA7A58|nr:laccase-12-like [Cryptomeria japonica]
MARISSVLKLSSLFCLILVSPWSASAALVEHNFTIGTQSVTRVCNTQTLVTVNGQYPGPSITVHEGDNLVVHVQNNAPYNVTLHWHGVRQMRSCWADGPAYVTQCPITPGNKFTYNFTIIGQEGTLWWHAHITYLRATVHGALAILPRPGNDYPFPKPDAEIPIILGEWWNANVEDVIADAVRRGAVPNDSDAYTINSQPGDFYPCSSNDTTRILVEAGKTYLLRIINCAMIHSYFFKIAQHNMTVVAVDAVYTKPYETDVLLTHPGNTMDVLITTGQQSGQYYIGTRVYNSQPIGTGYLNTTTTAILQYQDSSNTSAPLLPTFPAFNDTTTAFKFSSELRSLRASVPQTVDEEMFMTEGFSLVSCPNNSCAGLFGGRAVGSFSNISFVRPDIAVLQAYFFGIDGVYTTDFPNNPPVVFNYTGNVSRSLWEPELGVRVKLLKYNSRVQIVFQNTGIVTIQNHPIHLHGHDFYVVGQGFGNYNSQTDPVNFNLEDPQMLNTVGVPTGGWAAIRFTANNPGVWLMHCHFESHSELGFEMVFITEDGPESLDKLPPPPPDLLQC